MIKRFMETHPMIADVLMGVFLAISVYLLTVMALVL
jgi:hypothetical protein|tara:strand:+ start:194 stop:301 length:108 start_codon:yes stop_codon:yes gene_type:complete